jgi:hypothetical protein
VGRHASDYKRKGQIMKLAAAQHVREVRDRLISAAGARPAFAA